MYRTSVSINQTGIFCPLCFLFAIVCLLSQQERHLAERRWGTQGDKWGRLQTRYRRAEMAGSLSLTLYRALWASAHSRWETALPCCVGCSFRENQRGATYTTGHNIDLHLGYAHMNTDTHTNPIFISLSYTPTHTHEIDFQAPHTLSQNHNANFRNGFELQCFSPISQMQANSVTDLTQIHIYIR